MVRHRLWVQFLSLAVFVTLWQIAAIFLESDLLPSPAAVGRLLVELAGEGEIFEHVGATLARVAASFVLAMVVGILIGYVMGRRKRADAIFDSWLILFLNIPALVTIILCYVWFGLTEVAAITAVAINKIPNVAVTMREGARKIDRGLMEMAESFRLPNGRVLHQVVLPQLYPYLAASARSGLALIWKIVLVVELLGRGNGVGFQLGIYFQLFDVTGIIAYALSFIVVIQAIEIGVMQPLERRATAWQH